MADAAVQAKRDTAANTAEAERELTDGFHLVIDALINLAANLFTHMRMIRWKTIGETDRADRSIRDHMHIIEALEARDKDRAAELVRDHALGLAQHVERHADYLD